MTNRSGRRWRRLYFIALALLVVGAHVALLTSDRIPFDQAVRLASTNAMIWAVILLPGLFLLWRVRRNRKPD